MAQYTSTVTGFGGIVTNSILNTVTNTQTITVTAPTGQSVTITVDAYDVNSNFDNIVSNLSRQLNEQGADVGLRGITQGLNQTTADVSQQQQTATGVSIVTGNPPPAEKQAIPVAPADNPNPTPAPSVPPIESPTPEVINANTTGIPILTEDGTQSTFKRNPETGELYVPLPADQVTELRVNPETGETYTGFVDSRPLVINPGPITPPENTPTGPAYDDEGNLQPGWSLDEEGNPVWVGGGFVEPATSALAAQSRPVNVNGIQGPPYDDEGNLQPGWSLDEEGNPVWVGNNADGTVFVEPATQISAEQSRNSARGITTAKLNAASQATQQDSSNAAQKKDWRVRLSLAPSATYLYKVAKGQAGILNPLQDTNGVIFPYTPTVSINYAASYEPAELTHSNYKIYSYKNSSVDNISITCEFTAQDTYEANYLLAVIHFFRSVTKMFYGQDQNPKPGTPPPLCYLTGLGTFQFDNHPLAVTSFNYSLPNDVDYIRAGNPTAPAGVNLSPSNVPDNSLTTTLNRLKGLVKGGGQKPVNFGSGLSNPYGVAEPTYVPTKMQISISAVPIITRNDISNKFSLRDYATGQLLRGSTRQGGGIW